MFGIPPLFVPADNHIPDQLLATGSIIEFGSEADAALFESVADFHASLSQRTAEDPGLPGATCLTCHSDIAQLETINRKMPDEDGNISVTEEPNHHQVHATKAYLDFGDACTFCHVEFETEKTAENVTIASYVDKTTCAACHSRFAPRDLMEPVYYENDGCPGCHDPLDEGAWVDLHLFDQGRLNPPNPYGPYLIPGEMKDNVRGCLTCHGENALQMPLHVQDQFWIDRE